MEGKDFFFGCVLSYSLTYIINIFFKNHEKHQIKSIIVLPSQGNLCGGIKEHFESGMRVMVVYIVSTRKI